MKRIIQLGIVALTVFTLSGTPAWAQSTNKPSSDKKTTAQGSDASTSEKQSKGGPFRGKLASMDKTSKTITVGKRTFQITSETKIKKSGKPATLEDGVVGEIVSGYFKPAADGKLNATTVNFGPKTAVEGTDKPKKTPANENQGK